MKKKILILSLLVSLLTIGQVFILSDSQIAVAGEDAVAQGKAIAFNRKTGNCLACHAIADGSLPGNQGPALVAMKQRYPDIEMLKSQIFNPLLNNPDSMMPPFGLHNILSEEEIDKVAAFLYTL